ncbi:MAG: TIGR00730 family Rossman fold protein [Thermoanaerobaculia bacterium]|nr:TIGR00730 family Rossman fold protein [Thermoanaerobaculia bacterium]
MTVARGPRRIAVFCGSATGRDPRHLDAARELGRALVERNIGLVYGGGSIGLMGAIADAVLEAGGEVIGVIPRTLWEREVGHRGLTDLRIVETMHERKAMMAELSDAFVALPGGLGTLEELFEAWTWSQLGLHRKPCALLDAGGYYDDLVTFLDGAVAAGFVDAKNRAMLIVEREPAALFERIASYAPPVVSRWIDSSTS